SVDASSAGQLPALNVPFNSLSTNTVGASTRTNLDVPTGNSAENAARELMNRTTDFATGDNKETIVLFDGNSVRSIEQLGEGNKSAAEFHTVNKPIAFITSASEACADSSTTSLAVSTSNKNDLVLTAGTVLFTPATALTLHTKLCDINIGAGSAV